jgi:hypothetical protein
MKHWTREHLIRNHRQHVHSGKDARIQVLEVFQVHAQFWKIPQGSLMVLILRGPCLLSTDENVFENEIVLREGDQVIFKTGECFALWIREGWNTGIVQFICMPGISAVDD